MLLIKIPNLKAISELPSVSSQLKDEIKKNLEQRQINHHSHFERNGKPERKKNIRQSSLSSSDSSDDNK